jgi:hypothetical protein
MSGSNLSAAELAQRVAILKRFRELLQEQRTRFNDYLTVLDKQKDVIERGDAAALTAHVELEEKIVADIGAIQKVVEPLESLYRAGRPDHDADVPELKKALAELREEALARSSRNRQLLSEHMDGVRRELRGLRNNPFAARRSVYSDAGGASLVDLKG